MTDVTLEEVLAPGGDRVFAGRRVGPLRVADHVFSHLLDFRAARFTGPVQFFCCDFHRGALFDHAHFSQGATFVGSTFHGEASFGWTRFDGPAYFWRTHFLTGASFAQCVVQAPQARFEGYVNPGEANFSWALFAGDADFSRAHFLDRAWFWRTVFRGRATFDQARFGAAATFQGASHEVCVTARDFPSLTVFEALRSAGALIADEETQPPRFWHFRDTTGAALEARLAAAGLVEADRRAVEAVWRGQAHPMFVDGAMTGVTFDQPAAVTFSHVNLGRCLLADTDVEPLAVEGIEWARRRRRPLGWRMAVRDETSAHAPEALAAVARLYTRLRRNAERGERHAEASDFYYGEMEMRRRRERPLLRAVSLLALYKYLSGFGERSGLALGLLLGWVFLVFPAAYLVLGAYDGFARSVLHSLEVATFLTPEREVALDVPGRFAEGFQRLLVPLQAAMLALAVRRRFARR